VTDPRPTGWVDDPPGTLDGYEPPMGAEPPSDASELPREPWTDLFQEGQSCTVNGLVEADYEITGEKNSPYVPWWFARAEEYGPTDEMPDVGLSMFQFARAAREHGVCRMDLWSPGTPGFSIHRKPPALARIDAQRRNADIAVVVGVGVSMVEVFARAIDDVHVPLVVVNVDRAFEQFRGTLANDVIGDQTGPTIARHLMAARKQRLRNGVREMLVVNTWRNWGERNQAWVTAARLAAVGKGYVVSRFS
jgi:hypothetical protein